MSEQSTQVNVERLAEVVERIGDSMISTSETVEILMSSIDQLRQQTAQNHNSVMVLAEAVRALASGQEDVLYRLDQLIGVLHSLAVETDEEADHNT
ncbi:MAG: hypothetical protein VKL39_21240 [Leptolyngbyaceae bacterium]|nr:hypothetical protein [Leptolyngbyaceae bacterium]